MARAQLANHGYDTHDKMSPDTPKPLQYFLVQTSSTVGVILGGCTQTGNSYPIGVQLQILRKRVNHANMRDGSGHQDCVWV